MGSFVSSCLSFGVKFDDGTGFPWFNEEFDWDIGLWWRHIRGFDIKFEDFESECGKYYESVRLWDMVNPIPVSVVALGAGQFRSYLLATYVVQQYDDAVVVDLPALVGVDVGQESLKLFDFMRDFGITCEDEPRWYLSSYYG